MANITYESLDVDDDVVQLSSAKFDTSPPKVSALITVEDISVRYRIDGESPTATEGHLVTTNDVIQLESYQEIQQFKVISTSTGSVIKVTYW